MLVRQIIEIYVMPVKRDTKNNPFYTHSGKFF